MTFQQILQSFSAAMQLMFFALMVLGLLLSSLFLYLGMITGDNWTAVCGVLFAADRLGVAIGGRLSK